MKPKIQGLQLIINTDPKPFFPYVELAWEALLGGVDSIQFRHKNIYTREIYSIAQQIGQLCRSFSVPFLINDRADIALSIDAAGVHLGQTDLPLSIGRKILGPQKLIGCSASNLEQALQAEREGADYIGFGHIFCTKTKVKRDPPVGLSALQEVCKHSKIPILAIGGIQEHNIQCICAAGVCGVALVSALNSCPNPFIKTQSLKKKMSVYAIPTN